MVTGGVVGGWGGGCVKGVAWWVNSYPASYVASSVPGADILHGGV